MKILKNVKLENQGLLKGLKKLLSKSVIEGSTLVKKEKYHKFLKKLRSIEHTKQYKGIFVPTQGSKTRREVSKKKYRAKKMMKYENKFLVKTTHKLENPRTWMSALYYASNLKKEK